MRKRGDSEIRIICIAHRTSDILSSMSELLHGVDILENMSVVLLEYFLQKMR